eukprot:9592561-Heterocapsa_arctica.AAC.1
MQTINEAMQALAELAKPIQEAKIEAARAAAEIKPPNDAILKQAPKPRAPAKKRKPGNRLDDSEPSDEDYDDE